jgi:hypothetical protein
VMPGQISRPSRSDSAIPASAAASLTALAASRRGLEPKTRPRLVMPSPAIAASSVTGLPPRAQPGPAERPDLAYLTGLARQSSRHGPSPHSALPNRPMTCAEFLRSQSRGMLVRCRTRSVRAVPDILRPRGPAGSDRRH